MNQSVQLSELMKGKVFKILTVFLNFPTKEFSTNEIRKKVGLAKATLAKWLSYLRTNNLLQLKKVGATKLYKLEKDNMIIKQLKLLLNLTKLQILKKLINKYQCEIYLYGSSARGEDTEKSDIDLIVIADTNKQKIENAIQRYEKIIYRKLNTQVFDKAEWAEMERKDKAFYERVEKDKIRIS